MPRSFCISVTFLDPEPRFHGRGDGGKPEWPPSPLRLFQAIVAANGQHLADAGTTSNALRWLEHQPPPQIVAPAGEPGQRLPVYVPNNAMDLTAKAWAKGSEALSKGARPEDNKTLKTFQPTHLRNGNTVHYLWPDPPTDLPLEALGDAVGRVVALGWGIDLAVAQARVLNADATLAGHLWRPQDAAGGKTLRVAVAGTLDALIKRHGRFLKRVDAEGFHPVPPITAMGHVHYRSADAPPARPFRVFELRKPDGKSLAYPPQKLIHLAGMLRHLAIRSTASDKVFSELYPGEDRERAFTDSEAPPFTEDAHGWPDADAWVRQYVAGHRDPDAPQHRQLSYLPLPSIGHRHTNPAVRRVMIAGQPGNDAMIQWIANRLAGQRLRPDKRTQQKCMTDPPVLVPVRSDPIIQRYTAEQRRWATVTPVILPGYTDRKAGKTRGLIHKALAQAGVTQPCRFIWSQISRFPKSLPANATQGKKSRRKTPAGYIRPDYMLHRTAVHLEITFDAVPVPGPLVIGSARHCGLGVFADPSVSTSDHADA